ncbi:hypothetical protein [Streptomyces sp. KL116D]|uniref:hypothetical protein n=1 Tax=Streptomyces sp. KL116D TaxID=3045152 RepID=UPI003556B31F
MVAGHLPDVAVVGQSGVISPAEIDEMFRRRQGTVALSALGAGHDVHLERPAVLRGVALEFLAGADRAAGERTA